jgi:hypothetical protein
MSIAKKISPDEARRFVTWISQDLIRQGIIDPKGKTDEELRQEIIAWGKIGIQLISDHRPDLLRQARLFMKGGEVRLACLLYATWFEHWLNGVVSTLAERKGLQDSEITQIIRDTNFDARITWLLRILGARPISSKHRGVIKKVSELRNAFVHYKWKPAKFEDDMKNVLSEVEKTVKYLMAYESKYFFKSEKKRVRSILKGDT